MADGTTSRARTLPNFYSAAGQMEAYRPDAQARSSGAPPDQAQQGGERVQAAATLLEVVRKMDAAETDPAGKDILRQVVSLVEQYMAKVQPSAGKAAGTTTGETSAATATGAAAPPPGTGGTATATAA